MTAKWGADDRRGEVRFALDARDATGIVEAMGQGADYNVAT